MDEILLGIEGIACFLDDIIITGESDNEHLKHIEEVLERPTKHGITTKQQSVLFLRHRKLLRSYFDKPGVHPSSENIKAIKQSQRPTNTTELKSVLAVTSYYSRCICMLHEK
ncbi:Transposon Tf2-9 polyprotein [Thelohanellus kitauei]|uniref:Transposon Tf2-9 polyprotein n=1 Tax=Thelohanellus kitauei TaxID=669202 RepID=A0A0C2N3U4_THEKT|nr:Transposon Tf2-9 polyprotein [Thelohanellus kitauei]